MRGNRYSGLMTIFYAMVLAASVSFAHAADVETAPSETASHEPGLIVVFNRPLVVLRAPMFGFPPQQRAERAQERIRGLLAEEPIPPVSMNTVTEGVLIRIGDHDALTITPGDVDTIAGETIEELAERTVLRMKRAIGDIEQQRQWPFLIRASGTVLGATVLFILVVVAVRRLARWMRPRLGRLEEDASGLLKKSGLDALGQVPHAARLVTDLGQWVVLAGFAYFWLVFSLSQFPYTEPWGSGLGGFLGSTLSSLAFAVVTAIPDLFVVVVIVLATRFVVKVVKAFFFAVETGGKEVAWLDPEVAKATSQIAAVLIWMFALVMAYPYLPGSGSLAFQGMSVFLGVLVSLGASSVVGQFTSGLVLMYSRAVRVGEYVRFNEIEGTVGSLGFLSTKIQSKKNEEIHVPNTVLLGTTIKNYSRMAEARKLIVGTTVTIGYGAPWRQVHAMLIEAADRTPGLLKTPAPFVYQMSLSDFYVEYQLLAYIERPDQRVPTLSLLHERIQDLFNEHGVQIMSPHYETDPAGPVLVPKGQWYAPPARPPDSKT